MELCVRKTHTQMRSDSRRRCASGRALGSRKVQHHPSRTGQGSKRTQGNRGLSPAVSWCGFRTARGRSAPPLPLTHGAFPGKALLSDGRS